MAIFLKALILLPLTFTLATRNMLDSCNSPHCLECKGEGLNKSCQTCVDSFRTLNINRDTFRCIAIKEEAKSVLNCRIYELDQMG
jgi:hypothetical protein